MLRTPTWQSLQILPESYVHELELCKMWMDDNLEKPEKRFKGFKDYEVARLDRDIAWMRNGQHLDSTYIQQNKADFYRFFNEHDKRRGTNFLKTFPDMASWWKECKYLANNF